MAILINKAFEASEFFSEDEAEALLHSFDNLHLGSNQKKGLNGKSLDSRGKTESGICEDNGLSDTYLLNPIWGFQKEEFNGGVCQLRHSSEAGGVGNGGNLSPLRKCINPGLMSTRESLDFYNFKNTCVVDDLWEWNTQKRSSSSSSSFSTPELPNLIRWSSECQSPGSKDCFKFHSYGQLRNFGETGIVEFGEGKSHLSCGGLNLCPACPWHVESKINCSVPSEEAINKYLNCDEVVYIASSKEGSQYLQNVLAFGDEETVNVVFEGVYANIFEVMMDQYGQHLFNRTFDSSTVSQQEKLVLKMVSDHTALILAAKTQHGSHSLQKLVKKLKSSPLVQYIASTLALDMKALMISQYGKHVVQQCFILLDIPKCQKLYEALVGCCIELATDVVGCTSLNNSINNIKGLCRDRLLSILVQNSAFLSQDPSGNFVLQYILSLRNPTLSKKICCHLQGQFIHLSLHKSGSHLVEKCLKSPGIEYVITDLLANQKQLLQLARDQFGNYVLQTAVKVAKCHDLKMHQFLLQALEPFVPSLKYHPIGRNVFNVISRCLPLPKWGMEKVQSSSSGHVF
ncbi:hypothetical protein QQ045_006167 [Rhodiola kirilowii]